MRFISALALILAPALAGFSQAVPYPFSRSVSFSDPMSNA